MIYLPWVWVKQNDIYVLHSSYDLIWLAGVLTCLVVFLLLSPNLDRFPWDLVILPCWIRFLRLTTYTPFSIIHGKLDFCEFNINVFLIAVSLLVHSCVYSGLLWKKLGLINHETSMYYLKNNDFNLP